MTDKTLERLYAFWGTLGAFVLVALIVVGILGIKACTVNDRDRKAACFEAGGELMYSRCVKVEIIPTENWRR